MCGDIVDANSNQKFVIKVVDSVVSQATQCPKLPPFALTFLCMYVQWSLLNRICLEPVKIVPQTRIFPHPNSLVTYVCICEFWHLRMADQKSFNEMAHCCRNEELTFFVLLELTSLIHLHVYINMYQCCSTDRLIDRH